MLKISGTNGDTVLDALTTCDTLDIYDDSATPPATCAASPTGTLLASFTLAGFDSASGGLRSLSSLPITATVIVTGTPLYFRLSATGTCEMQGTIGRAGSLDANGFPWDILIGGARFVGGTTISISSFKFVSLNKDS